LSDEFFAPAPRGTTQLLAAELRALGARQVRERRAGVAFAGSQELAYRVCLWSRLASRVLMPLAHFEAGNADALYAGARTVDWEEHLHQEGTLAVNCNSMGSPIDHTHFAALRVKDAIVDRFRERSGVRPSVDRERPDLRINVFLEKNQATISLDLAGQGLHRRGYRSDGVEAPLKENLAAAILLRCGWPEVAAEGGYLVDLMCGSGTLPIEGGLMAADIAPGLGRDYFGFRGWLGHVPRMWERLLAEARERRAAGIEKLPRLVGYDADPRAVRAALANVEGAGLTGKVQIERRTLAACRPLSGGPRSGMVVVNPPYGERLGEVDGLRPLYAELGSAIKRHFAGWRAAVFTGNPELGQYLGLRALLTNKLYNGAIECMLLRFEVGPRYYMNPPPVASPKAPSIAPSNPPLVASPKAPPVAPPPAAKKEASIAGGVPPDAGAEGAEMFANRLRKNRRMLGRWARKEGISCFRLYDADMPEYALAVDLYRGEELWVHVQEYSPPKSVDRSQARVRRSAALAVIPQVLEVPEERVFFKVRERQRGSSQYEKLGVEGLFHEVREGPCVFWVNFTDYLDTGLFLDHRSTRALIGELAEGRRFLNLFGYTGTATVWAGLCGAAATTTVDMSRTYLDWAKRNLRRNDLEGKRHGLVQADCLAWLEENRKERYGLIFLDPPTFSNSKRMSDNFDLQRDHVQLIRRVVELLEKDGLLVFSNNFRRFKMDLEGLEGLEVEDIARKTLPRDFERNPRIHSCWRIAKRG
jgi:23S rRNA (guanine2445-N2)-methyltransferase / 23S rRNA (guanine2069-N7)-methyltransferase